MVEVIYTKRFEKELRKAGRPLILQAYAQLDKIIRDPSVGKPLRYGLKGERTVYVKPYRIIYAFEGDRITLLRFEHRDEVY